MTRTLADLRRGESGILADLAVPELVATRLMELGFLTGATVLAREAAPGGDPRVFEVDGIAVALRRETARCLPLEPDS